MAVIDLGSNTARLVVLRSIPGFAYRLEDEIREVARLREGMTPEGLSEEAIERAMFTLRLFKRFSDTTGVATILATATSAVREAANGPQFVQRVKNEIGISLEVLSGEREAYYAAIGALNEVPTDDGYVVDIGGGSAQISDIRKGAFKRGGSVTLGALALTEQFVRNDPISQSEFDTIQVEVNRQLDTLGWLKPRNKSQLVGLGGTIRNLARIESKRQNYPLNTLHGFKLSRESIAKSIHQFCERSLLERERIPGLSRDRADIILPGAMVIAAIMDCLAFDELTISVNGLREGVFLERFWQGISPPVVSDVRRFSVLNMARIYRYHKAHANHVHYLASRLFTQLASLHAYNLSDREILEVAALLHDLGTVINYEEHHKHSQMLILNNGLPGYSPREVALIALLTRYHRRGNPTIDGFESVLNHRDDELLLRLTALLRLAEYLERGRTGAVEDVTARWDDDTLHLSLIAEAYPAVELWDAERNAIPLMEDAFNRSVRLECISVPDAWVGT